MLPAQLVRGIVLVGQRDLVLAELSDLLLLHVGEELVLAVLDQLLLLAGKQVEAVRATTSRLEASVFVAVVFLPFFFLADALLSASAVTGWRVRGLPGMMRDIGSSSLVDTKFSSSLLKY